VLCSFVLFVIVLCLVYRVVFVIVLCLVCPVLFIIVLCLVYPVLSVYLDCPFLIVPLCYQCIWIVHS